MLRDVTVTSSISQLDMTSYVFDGHFVFRICEANNNVVWNSVLSLDKARRAKRREVSCYELV
jgi:hypothetical protein